MKKTVLLFLLIFLIAFSVRQFWPHSPAQKPPEPQNQSSQLAAQNQARASAEEPGTTPPRSEATDAQARTRIAIVRDAVNHANQPINYWGQVIDQDATPVPGVKVRLSVKRTEETLPGSARDVLDYVDLIADTRGAFSLTGRSGSLLTMQSLEKDGYEAPYVGNRAYWYEEIVAGQKFTPDAAKPEIFHMWKKAGAEMLVRKGIGHAIPYNGSPTTFNLLEDNATSPGDLRVTLVRDPQKIQWGQVHYDWTATIEAVDGGVIQSNDEQMYRAPTEGYQPKIVIHMPANATNWTDQKTLKLYLKIRSGTRYGRAELQFMVGSVRPTTPFSITSFINPSGSRNLEYDPAQSLAQP